MGGVRPRLLAGTRGGRAGALWLPAVAVAAAVVAHAAVAATPRGGEASVPGSAWAAGIAAELRQREYHVTWQTRTSLEDLPEAWHAPNRAHGFRIYFTGEGIRVVPRTEEPPSWTWALALAGAGRGGQVRAVEEALLAPERNRITYDRGGLEEWYVNSPRGLEQGFVLPAPPEELPPGEGGGRAASSPGPVRSGSRPDRRGGHPDGDWRDDGRGSLFLNLALSGSLSPVVSGDGRAIVFTTPDGTPVLRYAELEVRDATGRELPARMEAEARGGARWIRLVLDDREAVYPVTVDPLVTSPAWSAVGGQAGARFGISVATAGDVNGDLFSDVIVGADGYDNGQAEEGRAFVFLGSASGPAATPSWSAESDQAGARFGISVATAGDVNGDGFWDVIVGADGYDNGEADEGRAFVYHGSAVGLSGGPAAGPGDADWTAESDQVGAAFGISVATAGDVDGDLFSDVIVGADGYGNGEAGEGRSFVFLGSASGLSGGPAAGPSDADWAVESDQAGAGLGVSVATAGDVDGDGFSDLIIGAAQYDNGQTDEGWALVYHGSASGLAGGPVAGPGDATWAAEGAINGIRFGHSVATAGDVDGDGFSDVIIGAHLFTSGQLHEGRAYVYFGSASGLPGGPVAGPQHAGWRAQSDRSSARFGVSVSTAGDVNGDGFADVVVGADAYDNGEIDEGALFVFHGSPSGLPGGTDARLLDADQVVEGEQGGAGLGVSVATAGDVDGDGFSDVVAGASLHDGDLIDEGRALLLAGAPGGIPGAPDAAAEDAGWIVHGGQPGARLGWSVGTAGDVNGDGYADVIVGAETYDNGQVDEGAVFVFHGSATGLPAGPVAFPADADWQAEIDQANFRFGWSVSTAGDVNGDGYDDVIVGAYYYGNGQENEGRAFVYLGSPAGLQGGPAAGPGDAHWTVESDQANANLGSAVASAGDVNGDGYADVIVAARAYDNTEVNEGLVALYHGSPAGLSGAPVASLAGADWTVESNEASAFVGEAIATAGDVNADGFSDVIVGASGHANGQTSEGEALLYLGSPAGLAGGPRATRDDAAWQVEGNLDHAVLGASVGTAGDVNGDGYSDVVVGAETYDGATTGGRVFVYHGSASGLPAAADWMARSDQPNARFGSAVGTAGDVNGDGFADLIVGAQTYRNGVVDDGAAFVFLGSALGLPGGPLAGPADAALRVTAEQAGEYAYLGLSASTAGDVNGDGLAEIIIGAPYYHGGITSRQGGAFVFSGGAGAVPGPAPRQRRAVDLEPIAHLGLSDSLDSFRIRLRGRTPFGRGRVGLQWEVEPLGILFDGTGTQAASSWEDTGLAGVELEGLATGLVEGTVYHWRARLLHHPAATPFQPAGRWVAIPRDGWQEADLRLPGDGGRIGDRVWRDIDADGIQDPGEAGVSGILVELLDGDGPPGTVLDSTLTGPDGIYGFYGLAPGEAFTIRVIPPAGFDPSPADQGGDDTLDSDVDPATFLTPVINVDILADLRRWDAGLVPFCVPPALAVDITQMELAPGSEALLTFQDPNPPNQVTGYDVYRSADPSPPPGSWTQLASDAGDADPGTPGVQWLDPAPGTPPGGVWYYQVASYNNTCPAEGPF